MSNQTNSEKITELKALRSQARAWRIGAAITSVAITAAGLAMLHHSTMDLVRPGPQHDAFVTAFKQDLSTQVVPQIKGIARETWQELTPRVRNEVVQLQLRSPEIADGVSRELELLKVNLPNRAEQVLAETVGGMIQEREAKIREMYGDTTPEKTDRVIALLKTESRRRVSNVSELIVGPYEQTLQKIVADLAVIRGAESMTVAEAVSTPELEVALVQLANEELAKSIPAATPTPAVKPNQFSEAK